MWALAVAIVKSNRKHWQRVKCPRSAVRVAGLERLESCRLEVHTGQGKEGKERRLLHPPDTMENNEDEDDVKLARASAGLLADLEASLPKLLWKASPTPSAKRRVHSCLRRRDLDYVLDLVCLISTIVLSQAHAS